MVGDVVRLSTVHRRDPSSRAVPDCNGTAGHVGGAGGDGLGLGESTRGLRRGRRDGPRQVPADPKPYLGSVKCGYTDWTPKRDRINSFSEEEDCDESIPGNSGTSNEVGRRRHGHRGQWTMRKSRGLLH